MIDRTATRAVLVVACTLSACASPRADTRPIGDTAEALRQCPRGETVRGVDVSYHQGRVDWPAVRASGVGFGFARVSDGATFADPEFAANYQGMKATGVIRGAYQYFRPAEDPLAQADLLIAAIEGQGGLSPGDLPPALDIEEMGGVSSATLQAGALAWLGRVEARFGRTPVVYTSPGFWEALDADAAFARYTLWVAHWNTACPRVPGAWSRFRFWQDSDAGSVPGIAGAVDTDRFDGSIAELYAFAGGRAAPLAKVRPAPRPKSPNKKRDRPAPAIPWAQAEIEKRARQILVWF